VHLIAPSYGPRPQRRSSSPSDDFFNESQAQHTRRPRGVSAADRRIGFRATDASVRNAHSHIGSHRHLRRPRRHPGHSAPAVRPGVWNHVRRLPREGTQ
jgi:hypothetical protein